MAKKPAVHEVAEIAMPHDLTAERAVLGAMLLQRVQADRGVDLLRSDDFYRQAHRLIFAAIQKVLEAGSAPDLVTIRSAMGNDLDEAGGPAYLAALIDGVPRSVNLPHYAEIVKEKRRLRDVFWIGQTAIQGATNGSSTSSEVLEEADKAILALTNDAAANTDLVHISTAVDDYVAYVELRRQNAGQLLGVSTGLPTLDEMTCGLEAETLTIIGAEPGLGKTALCLHLLRCAGARGDAVAMVSLEMRSSELLRRMAAAETGIEHFKIRKGWLSATDRDKVDAALHRFKAWPVYFEDSSATTVQQVRAKIRRMVSTTPIKVVIIDYLQLMDGSKGAKDANRTQLMDEIARGLKKLSRELKLSVIALSQLSRGDAKSKASRPVLSRLRESGGLEANADMVLFLYRDEDKDDDPVTELIVSKQRNGPTGTIELRFDKPSQRFHDIDAEKSTQARPVQGEIEVLDPF